MLKKFLVSFLVLAVMLPLTSSVRALGGDVNKAPKSYLLGPETRISRPSGVAVDASGNRYIANRLAKSIAVFPPSASGNTAPSRMIIGSNTTMIGPHSIMVSPDGRIYVGEVFGADTSRVAIFAPGANGNVAPERVIAGSSTQLEWPTSLSLDSVGRLYVSNVEGNSVTVYAPGSDGNIPPIRVIVGAATGIDQPFGLVVTSGNIVHVSNYGSGSVTSYASGAAGNVAPIRTINGASTGLTSPWKIAADRFDNLYVTSLSSPFAVSVFGSGASGNVAPITRLIGSETDLLSAFAVAVTASHDVVLAQADRSLVTTYSPIVAPPAPPSAVRALAVSGKPSSAKRTVSWRAPSLNGGAPVLSYQVVVKAKGKTILTKSLSASKLKFTIPSKKLRSGKNTITVQARNRFGLSAKKSVIARVSGS